MRNLDKDHTVGWHRRMRKQNVNKLITNVCDVCYGTKFERYEGHIRCKKCGQIYYT